MPENLELREEESRADFLEPSPYFCSDKLNVGSNMHPH